MELSDSDPRPGHLALHPPLLGPVASDTVSATGNAAAARKVLENAGFTLGSNGYFEKNGQTGALTIISPAAYTNADLSTLAGASTGWPTQTDPYDSGQPSGTNNGPGSGSDEVVVLHLRRRT